jgi:hypothetical protein
MLRPLNFEEIKKQMKNNDYLRQWNLKAINASFENKAINQEQRDKLIALLYSKGKSDKLFKMRGHHITPYLDLKKHKYSENMMFILEKIFGNFIHLQEKKLELISENDVIEIVETIDDFCIMDCPFLNDCKKDDGYTTTDKILTFLESDKTLPQKEVRNMIDYYNYSRYFSKHDQYTLSNLYTIIDKKIVKLKIGMILRYGDIKSKKDIDLLSEKNNYDYLQIFKDIMLDYEKHYSYLKFKKHSIKKLIERYSDKIKDIKNEKEFISLLVEILGLFEDGHIHLFDSKNKNYQTYNKNIKQNYNMRLLYENYLKNKIIISNNVGLIANLGNNNEILYIVFYSWENQFQDKIKELFSYLIKLIKEKDYKLIIDVRMNHGGNDSYPDFLLSCLTDKKIIVSKYLYRLDEKDPKILGKEDIRTIEPNKNINFNGEIVVIIGNECMSSNEFFCMGLKAIQYHLNKKITLIGDDTFGSSGKPIEFKHKCGIKYWIPSWVCYTFKDELLEGNGIKPDIKIDSEKTITHNKDKLFELALEILTIKNFKKIKENMKKDEYLKQSNLNDIKTNFENKTITQEQRDKLIALLYSKGKSDKLFKMRGHHITWAYCMAFKYQFPEIKYFEERYNKLFAKKINKLGNEFTKESVIEVVWGNDYECDTLECPHRDFCRQGQYQITKQKQIEKIPNNAPDREEIIKEINNLDFEGADKQVLKMFNIKPGDIIMIKDLMNIPTIYHNGGFI